MRNIALLICGLLVLGLSCRKDIDLVEESFVYPGVKEYVKTSIGGIVIDENNKAIIDAFVSIGDYKGKTDVNGIFSFKNINVNSKNAIIKVERGGYLFNSKSIHVSAATRNTVRIQLIANNVYKTISGGIGGKISYNNYSVEIPGKGVVTKNGNEYTGQVKIYTRWLDPTDQNLSDKMPGPLVGISKSGSFTYLISMGMLSVQLFDLSNNPLQLKEGIEATIRMKVPTSLENSALSTIPLWYFDEIKGIWVEEGSANLVGGFYEGKVKHFTFWNCDYPSEVVEMKFKVVDSDGLPITNAEVSLQLAGTNSVSNGITDNLGEVSGLIPKGELLNVKVFLLSGQCTVPVVSQQIGPFNQDGFTELIVNSNGLEKYKIIGKLVDCDNKPIVNGYVKFFNEPYVVWSDDNGNFEKEFLFCAGSINSIAIKGYDIQNSTVSSESLINLSSGNVFNSGSIIVCISSPVYFTYTFGGNTYKYLENSIYQSGGIELQIRHEGTNDQVSLTTAIPVPTGIGPYVFRFFAAYGKDLNNNTLDHGCLHLGGSCSDITVEITEYGGKGQYISGKFAGTVIDSTSKQNAFPIEVKGSFRGFWPN